MTFKMMKIDSKVNLHGSAKADPVNGASTFAQTLKELNFSFAVSKAPLTSPQRRIVHTVTYRDAKDSTAFYCSEFGARSLAFMETGVNHSVWNVLP